MEYFTTNAVLTATISLKLKWFRLTLKGDFFFFHVEQISQDLVDCWLTFQKNTFSAWKATTYLPSDLHLLVCLRLTFLWWAPNKQQDVHFRKSNEPMKWESLHLAPDNFPQRWNKSSQPTTLTISSGSKKGMCQGSFLLRLLKLSRALPASLPGICFIWTLCSP